MTEEVYGTKYYMEDINEELLAKLKSPKVIPSPSNLKLGLPPDNIFRPENFDILEKLEGDLGDAKYP